jgi:hypothetical protein
MAIADMYICDHPLCHLHLHGSPYMSMFDSKIAIPTDQAVSPPSIRNDANKDNKINKNNKVQDMDRKIVPSHHPAHPSLSLQHHPLTSASPAQLSY